MSFIKLNVLFHMSLSAKIQQPLILEMKACRRNLTVGLLCNKIKIQSVEKGDPNVGMTNTREKGVEK